MWRTGSAGQGQQRGQGRAQGIGLGRRLGTCAIAGSALLLALSGAAAAEDLGSIVVNVANLSSQDGELVALLYRGDDGFPAKVSKAFRRIASKPTGPITPLKFVDIPYGVYAITIYHDVNGNQRLDTNFIGIPKEPVGVSNNTKARLGPPKFKDAKFDLHEATLQLTVNLFRP